MPVTAWKTPGSTLNSDRDGKEAWLNAPYAKADDGDYAINIPGGATTYGDWLRASQYGFTTADIPNGSNINGIEVKIKRKASDADRMNDSSVKLWQSGAPVGSERAKADLWGTTDEEIIYGGATDKWGLSISESDVRDTTFGVAISVWQVLLSVTGYVDVIWMRIYYSKKRNIIWGTSRNGHINGRAIVHPTLKLG